MTVGIAKFMRELEERWDRHLEALLVARDLDAALAETAHSVSIRHLPQSTGASGRADVQRFYAEELLPHLPDDLRRVRISRTVDRFRLVDETTVSFTHDRELPWLLPGAASTGRRAEVLAITVVGFDHGEIAAERILWDHATLTAQLGLPALRAPEEALPR